MAAMLDENLFRKLALREVHGSLRYCSRANPARLFKKYPGRCCIPLRNILDSAGEIREGHIILGFTKDGRYLISYNLVIETEVAHFPMPYYFYTLHWWEFGFRRPLVKVHSMPLFQQQHISHDLHILVSQSLDENQVIVWGRGVSRTDPSSICYLTIGAALPSTPCPSCQANSKKRCLKHSYTVNFTYEVLPPYPVIVPSLCLKIPGIVLINTGDHVLALKIAACSNTSQIDDIVNSFHGSSQSSDVGTTATMHSVEKDELTNSGVHNSPQDMKSMDNYEPFGNTELLIRGSNAEDCNQSKQPSEVSESLEENRYSAKECMKPESINAKESLGSDCVVEGAGNHVRDNDVLNPRIINCSELSKKCELNQSHVLSELKQPCLKTGESTIDSTDVDVKNDSIEGASNEEERRGLCYLQQKEGPMTCPSGDIEDSCSQGVGCAQSKQNNGPVNEIQNGSDDDGGGDHGCTLKIEVPEDATIPEKGNKDDCRIGERSSFVKVHSETRMTSDSSPSSGLNKCLFAFSNEKSCLEQSSDETKLDQEDNMPNPSYINITEIKKTFNTQGAESTLRTICFDISQNSNSSSDSMSPSGDQNLGNFEDFNANYISSNTLTTYTTQMYRENNENIYYQDEEEDMETLQSKIRFHVMGVCADLTSVNRSNAFYGSEPQSSAPSVLVCQASLDIEQCINAMIQSNDYLRHRFKSLRDYDVQIMDVCPGTGDVIIIVKVLLYVKLKMSSHVHGLPISPIPKLQQTGFVFSWNIRNGTARTVHTMDAVDQPEGKGFSKLDSAAVDAGNLRQAIFFPPGFPSMVKQFSNDTVFTGESLKYLKHPFLPILVIF